MLQSRFVYRQGLLHSKTYVCANRYVFVVRFFLYYISNTLVVCQYYLGMDLFSFKHSCIYITLYNTKFLFNRLREQHPSTQTRMKSLKHLNERYTILYNTLSIR